MTWKKMKRLQKQGKLIITPYTEAIPATRFIEAGLQASRPKSRAEMRKLLTEDVRSLIKRERKGLKRITVRF